MASKFLYERIFSGIQPSGRPHLGNYLGALRQWSRLQHDAKQNYYSIVDLHALTVRQDPDKLRRSIHDLANVLLACGVDPKRSVIFPQSRVLEHTNLAWLFMCQIPLAQLKGMPHLKEKGANKNPDMGLLTYPVLQAADILLYNATHVPVGEDQVPHMFLTRDIAQRFNMSVDQEIFVLPDHILDKDVCRVRDLKQPDKKMSKSTKKELACLYLDDTDDNIAAKIRAATTDLGVQPLEYAPEERPGVSNLVMLYSAFSGKTVEEVCAAHSGQLAPFKAALAELLIEKLRPIRAELDRLRADPAYTESVLAEGTAQAQQEASVMMQRVQKAIGLL